MYFITSISKNKRVFLICIGIVLSLCVIVSVGSVSASSLLNSSSTSYSSSASTATTASIANRLKLVLVESEFATGVVAFIKTIAIPMLLLNGWAFIKSTDDRTRGKLKSSMMAIVIIYVLALSSNVIYQTFYNILMSIS